MGSNVRFDFACMCADYETQPVFDEISILDCLSPSMRSEVVQSIMKESLGKLALFEQKLDPHL